MAFDTDISRRPQRTAFVLAGGGSCGAAQVGMLRELVRAGVRPDFLVGSSVGAMNGAWFAAAPTLEGVAQMESVWRGLRRSDVFPLSPISLLRLIRRHESLVDPSQVRQLLTRSLPCHDLGATAIPAHVVATDVLDGSPVRLCQGSTIDAVMASIAIPSVLPPVTVDGRLLMDGCIASHTPVDAALELGATHIIILPTARSSVPGQLPRSALEIGLHALSLIQTRQLQHHLRRGNAHIRTIPLPDLLPVSPFEFSRSAELIDQSAAQTRHWLEHGGLDPQAGPCDTPLQAWGGGGGPPPPTTPTMNPSNGAAPTLRIRRMGIDTYQEPVIYMRADCHVCRAEGFESQSRVKVSLNGNSVIATLNIVRNDLLGVMEAALSEAAWTALSGHEGDVIRVSHPEPLESFSHVRGKVYGHSFSAGAIDAIVRDVAAGRYSGLEIAAFVTVCAGDALSLDETIALTQAMVNVGQRLNWPTPVVADKHCVGGLPGNRTTPIVVAIAAACGLTIPKTSSRSITSPAGTADTMEMLAPVNLDLRTMCHVVEREGGCIVWGGAMGLSPTDDILIRIERPLDFDSEGQLTASVISKKLAAGSTHLVLDIPVGPTAKVRTPQAAETLTRRLRAVSEALGLTVRIVLTDGSQPVGRGIGPALEAYDVLAVLQNDARAPADLRERALLLAGHLLELAGKAALGEGARLARATLTQGHAWTKFKAICAAQGGMREPPRAGFRRAFHAASDGVVLRIDNRRLARIAKLAGAPGSPAAGIELQARIGDAVSRGQELFTVHAQSSGELAYAGNYAETHDSPVTLEPAR